MDRHLVTVKVRIKSGAYQRMQLNGLAFYQDWLKRLNTQPMQSRRPVQHDRVLTNDIFQDVPHDRTFVFDLTFRSLYRAGNTHYLQLVEDERLE
jgi:hypothetical protein